MLNKTFNKALQFVQTNQGKHLPLTKYQAEEKFWRIFLERLVCWYEGKNPVYYNTPAPTLAQKCKAQTVAHSAILTWFELHQKPKYKADLQLAVDTFAGMKLLDIGAGPMPSAEVFVDCELYCLDPLFPAYLAAGYPLHYYHKSTRFVQGQAEALPLADHFFDAVISVNAIDHVDDISQTAQEIRRVLKVGGRLRLHVHYHRPTPTEPLALDDHIMRKLFAWCDGFRKIESSDHKFSAQASAGESYNLWSNF